MKNIKKIVSITLTALSLLVLNPVGINAEWRQSNNEWWYSDGNSYVTGWKQIDGNWYLFDSNGYMKTGWQYDNGNWYYFYGEGIMAHDCWIGNYYISSSGSWTTETLTKEQAQQIVDNLKGTKYFDNDVVFEYNPVDNYMNKKQQPYYYIFNMVYGEDLSDRNICVDKYSGKVYICTPENKGSAIYKIDDYYNKYNIYV